MREAGMTVEAVRMLGSVQLRRVIEEALGFLREPDRSWLNLSVTTDSDEGLHAVSEDGALQTFRVRLGKREFDLTEDARHLVSAKEI